MVYDRTLRLPRLRNIPMKNIKPKQQIHLISIPDNLSRKEEKKMKLHFDFNLAAESGKITTDGLTAEIGQISCPIEVAVDLEASEIQQTVGLLKEIITKVPDLIKETHAHDMELAERRAKLEADNIRLRAELDENASQQAHTRAVDLVRLKAEVENHYPAESSPAVVSAEPRINRNAK